MKKIFVVLFFLSINAHAQNDSTGLLKKWSYTGFIEAYYGYDFTLPVSHERPSFLYNHKRTNEISLNMIMAKLSYNSKYLRGTLGLMAGTYPHYNYAQEASLFQHVYEASVGVRVVPNCWLDAGIFPSHLGAESALSSENITLSRSLSAENSPYYEAGAKLKYQPSEKWSFALFYLNGWQRIRRAPGNSSPAGGTQLVYTPSKKWLFNSSTFVGNDKPDSVAQVRYFHDFYVQWFTNKRLTFLCSFDVGWEKKPYNSKFYNWNVVTLLGKLKLSPKFSIGGRFEYYSDKHKVIVSTTTPNGFQTAGYSLNLDYSPLKYLLCRIEARTFQSKEAVFVYRSGYGATNTSLLTSVALMF